MAKLKFEMRGKEPTKIAIGMYSKDGELVNLSKPCDLNGQVQFLLKERVTICWFT